MAIQETHEAKQGHELQSLHESSPSSSEMVGRTARILEQGPVGEPLEKASTPHHSLAHKETSVVSSGGADERRQAIVSIADAARTIFSKKIEPLPMPAEGEPRRLLAWSLHEILAHTPRILIAVGVLLGVMTAGR